MSHTLQARGYGDLEGDDEKRQSSSGSDSDSDSSSSSDSDSDSDSDGDSGKKAKKAKKKKKGKTSSSSSSSSSGSGSDSDSSTDEDAAIFAPTAKSRAKALAKTLAKAKAAKAKAKAKGKGKAHRTGTGRKDVELEDGMRLVDVPSAVDRNPSFSACLANDEEGWVEVVLAFPVSFPKLLMLDAAERAAGKTLIRATKGITRAVVNEQVSVCVVCFRVLCYCSNSPSHVGWLGCSV